MDRVVVTRLLSSKKEDEAGAAQHLLAAARASQAERDEAVAVLLAVLEKDERRVRRRTLAALSVAVGVPCLFGMVALALAVSRRAVNVVPFIFCFNWLGSAISNLLRAERCSPVRARVALALAEHDDLRAVGPLVEAFGANVPAAPLPVVSGALKRLLPRVSPGEAGLLNDRQCSALNTSLREWDPQKAIVNPDEAAEGLLALLRLAALVGDKGTELAIATVRGRRATTDWDRRVVGAACISIEAVRARLDGRAPAAAPSFPVQP